MKQYPKLIYRTENRTCCTVQTEDQHELLKGYFCDELDHSLLPYTEIDLVVALDIHSEVKKEVEIEKISDTEIQNCEPEIQTLIEVRPDLRKLNWDELRALGNKLNLEKGVNISLRAKRGHVEKAIQEVLDGNDSKRCS